MARSKSVTVELQVACQVDSLPPEAEVRSWLDQAFQAGSRLAAGRYDVAVRIVDEDESRLLNKRYRQRDEPTNVLAFQADGPDGIIGQPHGTVRPLGDLVICAALVEREAEKQGKNLAGHWGHLLVHGMLHLLGYDHDTARKTAEMETMERQILADRGFGDPYRAL